MKGPPLLRVCGVAQRRGGVAVLDVDDLVVEEGEIVAVLGPNGAGKSTLFRILLLLETPAAGRIELRGEVVTPRDLAARRRLAGVFQRPHLFAGRVRDNVAFTLRARGAARRGITAACDEALARVGIAALSERDVTTLSGGEAQRVALARAIVGRPDLLLLDEPTAGLDARARRSFHHDLERVVRGGAAAALLITHDPADAFAVADRVVVLEGGRIVQSGSPADLLAAPATPFVAEFSGSEIVLDGQVVAHTGDGLIEVAVGAGECTLLAVPVSSLRAGERVHLAYRPEDVLLEPPAGGVASSARNRFTARVGAVAPGGGLVRVRLDAGGGVGFVALITRASADALCVRPGEGVGARIKASALRAYPAG